MDMFSGIASYATQLKAQQFNQQSSVSVLKGQQTQARRDGDAAVKMIESSANISSPHRASPPGIGDHLDVSG